MYFIKMNVKNNQKEDEIENTKDILRLKLIFVSCKVRCREINIHCKAVRRAIRY